MKCFEIGNKSSNCEINGINRKHEMFWNEAFIVLVKIDLY